MRTPSENISAEQCELAQRLRAAREDQGLSQQYVANLTGIPRTAISQIEHGSRRVDALELARLAQVYLRTASDFFPEDAGPTTDAIARILLLVQTAEQRGSGHRRGFRSILAVSGEVGPARNGQPLACVPMETCPKCGGNTT